LNASGVSLLPGGAFRSNSPTCASPRGTNSPYTLAANTSSAGGGDRGDELYDASWEKNIACRKKNPLSGPARVITPAEKKLASSLVDAPIVVDFGVSVVRRSVLLLLWRRSFTCVCVCVCVCV
jgi:hypothetical protein